MAAILAWGLYILSIPSANVLVLVGLVVAYAGRSSASGLPLEHLNAQIRLFWSVFWWTIACWLALSLSRMSFVNCSLIYPALSSWPSRRSANCRTYRVDWFCGSRRKALRLSAGQAS